MTDRPTVERILEGQRELMNVRIVPEREGKRTLGFTVSGIKPGSVLALIGIDNGDRLESVNGFDMSDAQKLLEAYARLRLADHLTLTLTREGRPVTVDYTVK